ncbi:MAG TPA: type II toxin-antitoxin system PemK/MazF family toxin [Caldilineaceae bacterium]|nr:type II toxin-antitoxin system PemK/MazF family toxin [Caldilineaceae bacterium]
MDEPSRLGRAVKRGEVRWVTFPGPDKRRPVVILTRDSALRYLTSVTVAPVTSTVRDIPSQVLLTPEEDGVPNVCAVSLDNVQTVRKAEIGALVTTLSPARLREVERALCFALGMDWLLPTER